jgi:hypothetical protein
VRGEIEHGYLLQVSWDTENDTWRWCWRYSRGTFRRSRYRNAWECRVSMLVRLDKAWVELKDRVYRFIGESN